MQKIFIKRSNSGLGLGHSATHRAVTTIPTTRYINTPSCESNSLMERFVQKESENNLKSVLN